MVMIREIVRELKHHAPFTLFGAFSGIILMFFFQTIPFKASYAIFYTFHPIHVFLSALVTASMYSLHNCNGIAKKCPLALLLMVGYIGSIGIATISDSLIPYLGEFLLAMPNREVHIGFIEEWWLVNPLALLGIAIAYFRPSTKIPHAAHVMLSTWASLFHIIMAASNSLTPGGYIMVFVFLFLAVWLPCCVSDIVFPLLFVTNHQK